MTRKILVTSALPYANDPIHIGHLVEYIQTDIWVRFQKMRGNRCIYICADDTHGTAIMIRARAEGRDEETLIADMSDAHQRDFSGFGIEFDHYGSTNSDANREICGEFWQSLRDADLITQRSIEQLFDPEAETFLADRFVRGTCPTCGREDQAGDNCTCGATYSPTDLIDPKSTLSGATPVLRESNHLFVQLEKLHPFLNEWVETSGALQSEVANYLKGHFLAEELRDWDISRPAPYFGFEIPDSPGNYWYVWFDAPIGYISATQELLPNDWEQYWKGEDAEIVHFIGKDNIVFHCIIFPAMLQQHGDYALPKQVPANEFLNLEGRKLSTSKNWAVWLHEFLQDFPGQQDVLRYVLTATMPETKDNDFTWADFQQRNNSELVAGFGNFVNRVMVLTHKYYDGVVQEPGTLTDADREALATMTQYGRRIAKNLEDFKFREAIGEAMSVARLGNKYLQEQEPWKVYKQDPARAGAVLYVATQITAVLSIVFEPFLPTTAAKLRSMLAMDTLPEWEATNNETIVAAGTQLGKAELLFAKIEDNQVEAQRAKLEATLVQKEEEVEESTHAPQKEDISFDQFMGMDLRVGTILEAERVPKADRLLKFLVDTGLDKRTIVSGIAEHFSPGEMVGKQVTVLMNLPPRKIRGVESQGMLLMAEDADGKLRLMSPEGGAASGSVIG